MKCPIDNSDLQMTERQGVEIDYCPQCRGVWLDRGELDKIIDRANDSSSPAKQSDNPRVEFRDAPRDDSYQNRRSYDDDKNYKRKHKRESFLGDLFDF